MAERRTHTVVGGGGVQLHVEETGNPGGPAVLLIHGYSQCRLAWRRQMDSDLAADLRLVAMDNRGHGLSEKPHDAYADSRLWADDVRAVIDTLELDRPILCCAYGVAICDYVRHHGEDAVAGYDMVSALTRLNVPEAVGTLSEDFHRLMPGLHSTDVETAVGALTGLIRLSTADEPAPERVWETLGHSVLVPPHVRAALSHRRIWNDDVLRGMRRPALVSHGVRDAIALLDATARVHTALIPNARLSLYPDAGHAPHQEDPLRFNRELRELALSAVPAARAVPAAAG
ncbi:MAG TPA: alpha/beta hydrolase [Candidatus Dormibacteraeota bacterium]